MNKIKLFKIYYVIVSIFVLNFVFLIQNSYASTRLTDNIGAIQQTLKERVVTINIKNQPIKNILYEIQKQSGISFAFNESESLEQFSNMTLQIKNSSVESALNQLLNSTDYTYKVIGNSVSIVKRQVPKTQIEKKNTIKGKVIDAITKKPLPGATIIVTGTANGAITDGEGNFILKVTPSEKEVQVSYTGYIEETVSIDGKNEIIIEMKATTMAMEDVVVTGVFTRKQNTYTGAVSTIKAEELKRTGNMNVLQALGNIDASFMIVQNLDLGSNPNAMPDIQMRGSSAFSDMKDNYSTNPNQPLFIIDGFEASITKVMDMDMNRVLSVTLLKDATAKAIYGSKGANGVVVIETNKPEKGTLRFSYKGDLNIQVPDLSSYNMANSYEKLEIERKSGMWGAPYMSPITLAEKQAAYNRLYKQVVAGANTNWMAIPVRTGIGQKHTVNIEGGDDVIAYGVNVAYNNVAGVMKKSGRETLDAGFQLSYRYKNLVFREQFDITSTTGTESPYGSFSDYVKMNPYWRAYKADGTINRELGVYNISNQQGTHKIYNPLLNADSNYKNTNEYLNITNNFYIEYQATKDLKLIGRLGFTSRDSQDDMFYPSSYTSIDPNKQFLNTNINYISITPDKGDEYFNRGIYQVTNGKQFSLIAELSANYSKQIGKNLIFANAQYSISNNTTSTNSYVGTGFADNATSINQAKQYKESSAPTGYENSIRDISIITSINYSYDEKYLVDANYRAGASSLFGANNRWGNFWSLGIGWNLHEEKFLKNTKWLDQLKLRASTGYSGSQNFQAYQAIAMYQYFSEDLYDNIVGAYLMGLSNPDLKWQQTRDDNIGLSLTINKRLDANFNYYVSKTKNMLTPISVVSSTGFSSYYENLGEAENRGFEFDARYRIIADTKRDFFLSATASIASNTNKITKINDALQGINNEKDKNTSETNYDHEKNKDGTIKPKVRYKEGQSLSAIWAVRSLGIDPASGKEIFLDKNNNRVTQWNAEDQVVVGDNLEKYRGNFGFNGDYKGFTFNANFAYRLGGQTYNSTLVDKVENVNIQYNVDKRAYSDSWTEENRNAKYKKITDPNYFTQPTSRFVQDLNELRLANLSIGYDFRNTNLVKKGNVFSAFKVVLNMNDVFTLSTVKQERGTIYPFARSFILSVSATF